MDAPTASELEANPVVKAALAAAWADSLPDDSAQRHEEGGWIYHNLTSGEIEVRRSVRGSQVSIPLANPPHTDGCVVVGKFHTHPNPSAEGWEPDRVHKISGSMRPTAYRTSSKPTTACIIPVPTADAAV